MLPGMQAIACKQPIQVTATIPMHYHKWKDTLAVAAAGRSIIEEHWVSLHEGQATSKIADDIIYADTRLTV